MLYYLLKFEYEKLDCLRSDLEKKSSSMQVDFNIHKIYDTLDQLEYNHRSFKTIEFKNLIEETIRLGNKYSGILPYIKKAQLQFILIQYCYIPIYDYYNCVEELYKVLDTLKNEENDDLNLEVDDLKLDIYKTMIGLAQQNNDMELYKEIIKKMGTSMDETIREIITNTTYAFYPTDIPKIEIKYNELADFFGYKFFEILTEETKKEYFKEAIENKEFKDFFIKFIDQKIDKDGSSQEKE